MSRIVAGSEIVWLSYWEKILKTFIIIDFFKLLETHTHIYNSCFFRDHLVFLLLKTEYY